MIEFRMIDKLYNYFYWLSSFMVVIYGGYFVFKMYVTGPEETRKSCLEEMKSAFHGKIVAISPVPNNPKCKYIVLSNKQRILQPYTFGLWMQVEVDDSLVKVRNTLDYIVFRKINGYAPDTIHFKKCK